MRIIAGEARGRKLVPPADRVSRPPLDQIRKSVFSILEGRYEGRPVLDLFAGVGAFGLEAVSRGASHAVFVERASQAVATLETNVERLGFLGRCTVLTGDAFRVPDAASDESPRFAVVFFDPPFPMFHEKAGRERIARRLTSILQGGVLEQDGVVVVRQPKRCREALPFRLAETRRYGESVVSMIEVPEAGASAAASPVDGGPL